MEVNSSILIDGACNYVHIFLQGIVISYVAYIGSTFLTEVPRAIFHSCLLNGILYLCHPLNPDPAYATFSFVCLMVGVSAWQSVICVCSVISGDIRVSYSASFLILGM